MSTETVLFEDDFSSYKTTDTIYKVPYRDELVLGPWRLYSLHYEWTSKRFANWTVTGFPWAVGEADGIRYIEMPDLLSNVVLAAGDARWEDYAVEMLVAWTGTGTVGALFRYQTSRHNYRLDFVEGKRLRIIRRSDAEEVVLAERDHALQVGAWNKVRIECERERIRVRIDGRLLFDVEDDRYLRGRIGLRAHGTGRFARVRVTTGRSELAGIRRRSRAAAALAKERASAHPRCVKKQVISLPRDYSFVHVVDLDGDGSLELVGFLADVLRDDYTNIAAVGVHDFHGRELWYQGHPRSSDKPMHSDVAYQIGDLNGDRRKEIIFTQDFQIRLVDGMTGELLRRAETPASIKGTEDAFPRIIGDSFHLCNLRGAGGGRDFLLKDRYSNIWAYTADFEPLWHRQLNTGHYPRAADINGDGRDEVMAGYSMLDSEGKTMWTVPGGDPLHNRYPGPEHADSLWIGRFKDGPDAPIEIAIAASDLGFNLLDVNGKLLARDLCGHAQSLGIAKFRRDVPGRQFLVADFWGNPGIMVLLDCYGNRLCSRELDYWPTPVPVKWDRCGEALFYGHVAGHDNAAHGGGAVARGGGAAAHLLDGSMREVVTMPRGEWVRPSFMDVDGDGCDEFLFLDGRELQIWGREAVLGDQDIPDGRTFENYNEYGAFYL